MTLILIDQRVSVGDMASIMNQFQDRVIKVNLTNLDGTATEIGELKEMVPERDCIKGRIHFLPGFQRPFKCKSHGSFKFTKNQKGFTFSNFYGTWVISKPWVAK